MSDLTYLFIAYTIVWAILFCYLLFMQWKQRKLQQQIDMLKESTDKPISDS